MPINTQDIFTHLKHAHIFRRLDDETLNELAMRFQKGRWKAGDVILEQGEMARHFFFIYYGEVEVIAQSIIDEETVETIHLGKLGVDDYFGESSILEDMEMEASVKAVNEVVLLFLPREEFLNLLEDFPSVYEALLLVEQTRLRVIDWQYRGFLGEEEAVFLLVNKHWFWVAVRLILPILSIILIIASTVAISFFTGTAGWIPMIVLLILCAAWIGLVFVDYRDDNYVITNQRVIAEERLAILHRVHAEAPLWTVRSVQILQDTWGRALNFGDVTVQTITGSVVLRDVPKPYLIEEMLKERIERTRYQQRESDEEALRSSIRQTIGWEEPAPPKPRKIRQLVRPTIVPNPFVFRIQQGETIIWRRHPVLLFQRTLSPLLLFFATVVILILRGLQWPGEIGPLDVRPYWQIIPLLWWWLAASPILLGVAFWWLYQYMDWTNDTYSISNERLIDAERAPFLGEVQQRSAMIESVLNVSYSQPSIIAQIFNYGSVVIETGGDIGQLTFDGVYNPLEIQQEIFRRMEEQQRNRRETEAARRRNEIVQYLRAYAQVTQPTPPETPYTDLPDES